MKVTDDRLLVQLRVAELDQKLEQLVLRVAELTSPTAPALLTRKALASALSCSEKHIDRLRREGLPELRVGDSPRFELVEVLRWLRARDQVPGLRLVDGAK